MFETITKGSYIGLVLHVRVKEVMPHLLKYC